MLCWSSWYGIPPAAQGAAPTAFAAAPEKYPIASTPRTGVADEGEQELALDTGIRGGALLEQGGSNFITTADAVGVAPWLTARDEVVGATTNPWLILDALFDGEFDTLIDLLVGPGADVNQRNAADWGPLHWVLTDVHDSGRRMQMVKKLLESGADVNAVTAGIGWDAASYGRKSE